MRALSTFVNDLTNQYTRYFDVYRDQQIDGWPIAFYAVHHRRDERYMLSKKIKVYGIENQELAFTTVCESAPTLPQVQDFKQMLERQYERHIDAHEEHMSTVVYGIIVTEEDLTEDVAKEVKKYRKLKFLKFGLHGWIEYYIIVVNPHTKRVWVHKKGEMFTKSIQQIFERERESL